MRLHRLSLVCKRGTEVIEFSDVSYFYGEIGSGKSSIARLVDYCLGGQLRETPALQSEFVETELLLTVGNVQLTLTRARGSSRVHAAWVRNGEALDALVPARQAAGEVLPGTGVSVLSDLVFYLTGLSVPRIRQSKLKEDSELVRLSLRDLLWYCYLEQVDMESIFFHLEPDAEFALRNKSRDVLRYVLGFHQERIAELERDLDDLRIKRRALEEGAASLRGALSDANIGSEDEIDERLGLIRDEIGHVQKEIEELRSQSRSAEEHGADALRQRARLLADEVTATEEAIGSIEQSLVAERQHLNELKMLQVRFRRSAAARAALRGVAFEMCPCCMQPLAVKEDGACPVCGQRASEADVSQSDIEVSERDAKDREAELQDSIARREAQLKHFARNLQERRAAKSTIDADLSEALRHYDSLTMSSLLALEGRKAALAQEGVRLERVRVLPGRVTQMLATADALTAEGTRVRRELSDEREKAERDLGNLRSLEALFKDCLVRANLPGIGDNHEVSIRASDFYPQVVKHGEENVIVANHGNLMSGGKATIFKCCFAIALHRLAAQVNAPLPTLLIIDTPMKNISERNNRPIFEAFYDMLYELAAGELAGTQFLLLDKEFRPPPEDYPLRVFERYMTTGDPSNPPLIGYFRE